MAYKTPNADRLNGKRATAAAAALNKFAASPMGELVDGKLKGATWDLRAQNVTDLLCDLAHYCDREGLNFAHRLHSAESHYRAETSDKGPQTFRSLSGPTDEEQRELLKAHFDWIDSNEEAEGSDVIDGLTEWWASAGGTIADEEEA